MLCAVGVTHVIIGHSERRQYFGETDDTVNLKLKSAIEAGLIPIVCVGEVLEEREAGLTDDVLRRQCLRAFNKVSAKKAANMVVAYEPVWAIGTGKTATPEIAADAHAIIRGEVEQAFGSEFLATTCASSTVARSNPTTRMRSCQPKELTARWWEELRSIRRPSARSLNTEKRSQKSVLKGRGFSRAVHRIFITALASEGRHSPN